MVPAVDQVWEELGAERLSSPKSNALAAWRFEPCSTLNDKSKQGGWIAQPWQQREMESLTLALQRELSSSSTGNNNDNENKKMLQVSDSSMASSGAGFNLMATPSSSSSSSRLLDAVGSPVTSSEADTTRAKSHLASPEGSNGEGSNAVCGIVGHGNQFSGNGGRASPAPVGNKNHPLSTITGGKVSKTRRSRASSKSPITFLNADPANFRAMVQQVTGVPLNPTAAAARLWSPSGGIGVPLPKRDFSSSSARSNNNTTLQGLPTLDTSALLINMSQDRFSASQQRHVLNSYSFQSPPFHESISSEAPSSRGEFFAENLRAPPRMQSWMKMGGSLPFPMSMSMSGQEMDSSSLADSFLLDSEAGGQHGIPLDLWLNPDGGLNNSSKLSQAELSTSTMTTCTSLLV